jgi:hypothetical protein
VVAEQAYNGSYSAASGDIANSQESWLQVEVTLVQEGLVSFYHKESTEEEFDYLEFYIDGVKVGHWSGITDWRQFSQNLEAGIHILRWEYDKDGSISEGADTVWIDDVIVTGIGGECDDSNTCTIEGMDQGSCVYCPVQDATPCDDGLWCNGIDRCEDGKCIPGTPPEIDDQVSCTNDYCDEENDEVVHTPDHEFCQDGLWCNGAEICDIEKDCQDGPDPNLSDGVECTVDTCDEGEDVTDNTGQPVHTPRDRNCDDGNPCTEDRCDVVNDCQHTLLEDNECQGDYKGCQCSFGGSPNRALFVFFLTVLLYLLRRKIRKTQT